jgi:hypothetical protein
LIVNGTSSGMPCHTCIPFVEAFYLEKASRRGRMLTVGGKLLVFAAQAATHRQKSWQRVQLHDRR